MSNMITAILGDNEMENGKIESFDTLIFDENMPLLISSMSK